MPWPVAAIIAGVSAVASIAGGVHSANSASAQNRDQASWARYNSQAQYGVSMANIRSQQMLGVFNASMQMKAAQANANASTRVAEFNAEQVKITSAYNSELLDEELRLLWEAQGLDQEVLERQRGKERSNMLAAQSASGTTMGYASNAGMIQNQMAQEAMDSFVVRHNADIGASKILNAQAQGSWQADMQVQKIIYEGQVSSAMTTSNARAGAMGTLMNTMMSGQADTRSAQYGLSSGMSGASQNQNANSAQISANLTQGLFSTAANTLSTYYSLKTVTGAGSTLNSSIQTNADKVMADSMNYSSLMGSSSGSSLMSTGGIA